MKHSFGKCKMFDPIDLFKNDDCRNCSHANPSGTGEYKVGDWCKNYSTKTRRQFTKSEVVKPTVSLIKPKDFSSRRT